MTFWVARDSGKQAPRLTILHHQLCYIQITECLLHIVLVHIFLKKWNVVLTLTRQIWYEITSYLVWIMICFLSIHIKKYVWNRFQEYYKYCNRMNIYIYIYCIIWKAAVRCAVTGLLHLINCITSTVECFYSEGILTYSTDKKARSAMPILV